MDDTSNRMIPYLLYPCVEHPSNSFMPLHNVLAWSEESSMCVKDLPYVICDLHEKHKARNALN